MGLLTTVLLSLATLAVVLLLLVRKALAPIVPLKGKTNIPGPGEGIRWPIIGHALWFYGVNNVKDLWVVMDKLCRMRESIMSIYIGSKLTIFLSDPKILEKLISANKCSPKEEDFYSSFTYFTDGVLSRQGERWVDLRRPLDKLLHPKNMDTFLVTLADKAKISCDTVQKKCGEGIFDLHSILKYYSMDATLENFFGLPGTQQLEDTMNLPASITRSLALVLLKMLNPMFKVDWIFELSSIGKEMRSIKNQLRPHLKQMFVEGLKKMEARGFEPNDPTFEPENYLEVSIQAGLREKLDMDTLIFSYYDFLIAGADTTAISVPFAILYLAMHPEYQEKAYQEQLSLMRDSSEAPSRVEMSRMKYLDMVFNETLRKVSPPAVLRTVTSEAHIDGYVLPEGASLYVMFHHMASDPKYWERPDDFYPEHFLPENVAKRPKYCFLPFSFGSRSCPGRAYGTLAAKLIISMLLRRFEFTTTLPYEKLSYKYMIMVEPEHGYPMAVTPRIS